MAENFFSIYSLIYIPLLLSVFVQGLDNQKKMMIFWIIVLTLFRGLRWDLGTDWGWYERSFNEIDITNFWCYLTTETEEGTKMLESGWGFMLMVCKYMFGSYTAFLLFSNLLRLSILYLVFVKMTRQPIFGFVAMIETENFFPVRQDLANVIYALGFCYLLLGNKIRYFVMNGLSVLVHSSSVVLLPLYGVLKNLKFSLWQYLLISMLALVFSEIFVPIMLPVVINVISIVSSQLAFVVSRYFELSDSAIDGWAVNDSSLPAFIINCFFLCLFYFTLIKKNQGDEKYNRFIYPLMNAYVFSITINLMFLRTIPPLSRLSSYFGFAFALLVSFYFQNLKSQKIKLLSIFVFICYYFYRYWKHFNFYPELHFPYQSVFDYM